MWKDKQQVIISRIPNIKNTQGYSLNQLSENKLRDESYVNCQFILASNMTLYTVHKSVCEYLSS
jgi:hypothetical protein